MSAPGETREATLTGFLLARIAEDEAEARPNIVTSPERARRMQAECEAKRRLVRWCGQWGEPAFREPLAFLALPYTDHPDYREEWKP